MNRKINAGDKLHKVEEKRMDKVVSQLALMQKQHANLQHQFNQLISLKQSLQQPQLVARSSLAMMNGCQRNLMIDKMLAHCQHEQAVIEAQCNTTQKELQFRQARVKGLENVIEQWRNKQRYEKAKKEQKQLEEIINARCRKRRM